MDIRTTGKIEDATLLFCLREKLGLAKHPFLELLNKADQDYLSVFLRKAYREGDFAASVFLPSGQMTLLIGAGDEEKFNWRRALRLARQVISFARKERVRKIEVNLVDLIPRGIRITPETVEVLATQFEIANFEFISYKQPPKEGWHFVEAVFVFSPKKLSFLPEALARGKIIGEEINKARALSNTPGGDLTPALLANAAQKSGRESGFRVRVLGEREIRALKMGGILGVSRGSVERPRFIVMEYRGAKDAASQKRGGPRPGAVPGREAPLVLVGKGVTFDTGGLNLKSTEGIYEMHMDMSGGAAVMHTIAALARLKVKKNVVGLVPAVENMPSGSSYHPGDLLRTMSGKTIEVLNTDAEGRIILADALEYAKKYAPRLVVDIATLTGAAVVALGQRASAVFTSSPKLESLLRESGEHTGDFVWPLPLWEEYEEEVKGTFGDVANTGKTRYGGAITGAVFLWQFVKDKKGKPAYPWVHIDIAPRMTSVEGDYLTEGAAGASIALLAHFLRKF